MKKTVDITLQQDTLEGTQATVSQWLCSLGEPVMQNQPLLELETDKVMMEIVAPASGRLAQILVQQGESIDAQTVLGTIDTATDSSMGNEIANKLEKIAQAPEVKIDLSQHTHTNGDTSKTPNSCISPAVRRLIKQHKLNINTINGTGKNQRITSRDIQSFLLAGQHQPKQNSSHSEIIPISNMRKSIANHMVHSLLHTAPHVTSVFNCELSSIIAHRHKNKQAFAEQGAHLTFTAYFIAASVLAIKVVPIVNAQLHADSIEIFKHINIGIGTALGDKGLIVPVLKNCENQSLLSIAQHLTQLTEKARHNKLSPADVQGGTFTISNYGVSGSLLATPIIIKQPQSAILGVGKMEKRVVVKEIDNDDVMLIKPMCYVSLTIDHRLLDAHQTNLFLNEFVSRLENWQ